MCGRVNDMFSCHSLNRSTFIALHHNPFRQFAHILVCKLFYYYSYYTDQNYMCARFGLSTTSILTSVRVNIHDELCDKDARAKSHQTLTVCFFVVSLFYDFEHCLLFAHTHC